MIIDRQVCFSVVWRELVSAWGRRPGLAVPVTGRAGAGWMAASRFRGAFPVRGPETLRDHWELSRMPGLRWRVPASWRVDRGKARQTLHHAETLHGKPGQRGLTRPSAPAVGPPALAPPRPRPASPRSLRLPSDWRFSRTVPAQRASRRPRSWQRLTACATFLAQLLAGSSELPDSLNNPPKASA